MSMGPTCDYCKDVGYTVQRLREIDQSREYPGGALPPIRTAEVKVPCDCGIYRKRLEFDKNNPAAALNGFPCMDCKQTTIMQGKGFFTTFTYCDPCQKKKESQEAARKAEREAREAAKINRVAGRVCWSCKHFCFDGGSPGYSEYTPGDDAELKCEAGEYDKDMQDMSQEDLEATLKTAETCAKFEERGK
jgi:hypothetical protein